MPRKPFNPNTPYGRKKLREQAEKYRQSLPEDQRQDFDATKIIIMLVIVVIAVLIFMAGGSGALKWLSH